MNEAEANVIRQMKNQPGAEMFAHSAKTAAYNKLMGISTASAYRQPMSLTKKEEPKSVAPKPITVSAEKFDLTIFNR